MPPLQPPAPSERADAPSAPTGATETPCSRARPTRRSITGLPPGPGLQPLPIRGGQGARAAQGAPTVGPRCPPELTVGPPLPERPGVAPFEWPGRAQPGSRSDGQSPAAAGRPGMQSRGWARPPWGPPRDLLETGAWPGKDSSLGQAQRGRDTAHPRPAGIGQPRSTQGAGHPRLPGRRPRGPAGQTLSGGQASCYSPRGSFGRRTGVAGAGASPGLHDWCLPQTQCGGRWRACGGAALPRLALASEQTAFRRGEQRPGHGPSEDTCAVDAVWPPTSHLTSLSPCLPA